MDVDLELLVKKISDGGDKEYRQRLYADLQDLIKRRIGGALGEIELWATQNSWLVAIRL